MFLFILNSNPLVNEFYTYKNYVQKIGISLNIINLGQLSFHCCTNSHEQITINKIEQKIISVRTFFLSL